MTTGPDPSAFQPPPTGEEFERDGRFEVLLDEMVASSPELELTFVKELMEARPFAPWEVGRKALWRVPGAAAPGLLVASAGIFMAPLWRLGPATAFALWGRLALAAVAGPVKAAVSAAPVLAGIASHVSPVLPAGEAWLLGGLGAAAFLLGVLLARRRPVRSMAR